MKVKIQENNDGSWVNTQIMMNYHTEKPYVYVELGNQDILLDMSLNREEALSLSNTLKYFAAQVSITESRINRGPTYAVRNGKLIVNPEDE